MRISSASRRSSSSRAISAAAKASNVKSASGAPRHSPSACLSTVAAASNSLIAKRVAAAIEQPLERAHVDLLGLHAQHVAVIDGDDQPARRASRRRAVERLAQPRDVDLHRLGRRRRRAFTPQRLDQPIR